LAFLVLRYLGNECVVARMNRHLAKTFGAILILFAQPPVGIARRAAFEFANGRQGPPSTASRIAGDIQNARFGVTRRQWETIAAGANWQRYVGSETDLEAEARDQPEGVWCNVATDRFASTAREAVFYAFREGQPLDCRLEELKYTLTESPGDATYDLVLSALREHFGPATAIPQSHPGINPERPDLPAGGLWSRHTEEWSSIQHWQSGGTRILLYRQAKTVQVLATSDLLRRSLKQHPLAFSPQQYIASSGQWQLLQRLEARFPEAVALIESSDRIVDQERVRQSLLAIFRAHSNASSDADKTALMILADRLAGRLRIEGDSPIKGNPQIADVLAHGVSFSESPFDAGIWYYNGSLAKEIRRLAPESFWGQFLTVADIDAGGEDMGCDPTYDDVITNGRAWLTAHPKSVYSPLLILDIAQAYETKWSVGQRPNDQESRLNPQALEEARKGAIEWYARLLREYPSEEAKGFRWNLAHLKLGADSAQRRYFCEYA
jgi:hypothetical protein